MEQGLDSGTERASRVVKKPFLRKGSRKEPSALHRSPSPAKPATSHRDTIESESSFRNRHIPLHNASRISDPLDETLGDDTQSVLAVRDQYQQRQMKEQQELSEFEQIELELRRGSSEQVSAMPKDHIETVYEDDARAYDKHDEPHYAHDITDWKSALNTMHSEMGRLGIDDSPALQANSSHFYGDWSQNDNSDDFDENNDDEYDNDVTAQQNTQYITSHSSKAPSVSSSLQYQFARQKHQYDSEDDIVAYNNTETLYRASRDEDENCNYDAEVYSDNDSALQEGGEPHKIAATARVNDSQSWGSVTRPVVRPSPIHGSTVNSAITRPAAAEDARGNKSKPQLATSVKSRVVRPLSANRAGRKSTGSVVSAGKAKPQEKDASPMVTGDLATKARELEAELEHYKKETAALRQAKKQHDSALAEIQKQKAELHDWVAAEKAAAEKWCNDLRNAAAKERKAAALKHMREMSQRSALGSENSRKERAEIEGLHATIEKLKLDHEQSERKLKATILRLQNLTRDQGSQINDLQAQIASLETENSALKIGTVEPQSNKSKHKKNKFKNQSYAEEVSLDDVVDMTTDITYITKDDDGARASFKYEEEEERSISEGYDHDDRGEEEDENNNNGEEENRCTVQQTTRYEMPSYHAERYQTLSSTNSVSTRTSLSSTQTQPKLSLSIPTASAAPFQAPDSLSRSTEREESVQADGTRVTKYRNGTIKLVRPSGDTEVRFVNGDVKLRNASDGSTKYYYASAQTTHTSHPDGREVYEFPNKQKETHYSNGKKEILFPDGTHKTVHTDGVQESLFPDGIRVIEYPNGEKKIVPPARKP